MTTNRYRQVAVLLMLVVSGLAVASGGMAAPTTPTEDAQLAIEQPVYVEDGVQTTTINGTRAYVVSGEDFDIRPRNFNASAVVDYGVDAPAGELSFDPEMQEFAFDPQNETGTFQLFWIVNEPREVTVTQNNTTVTETRMQQVRYEAIIRVEGQTAMQHVPQQQWSARQDLVEIGREVKDTIAELKNRNLPLVNNEGSTLTIFQSMVDSYVSIGNPLAALTGTYTQMWMLALIGGVGGILFLLTFVVPIVVLIRRYRGEKNKRAEKAAAEGALADREVALADRERVQKFANMDWHDIFEDDHVASAFRDTLGETVLDGWMRFNSVLQPRNLIRDRLAVMGQSGYVARVTDRDDDDTPLAAEVVTEDAVADEDDVVSLDDPSDDLVDAIDWSSQTLADFDIGEADVDLSDLNTDVDTLDLDALVEDLDAQMRHFDDPEQFGEYLHEFVASVREHDFTDEQGEPDDVRYTINCWLMAAQVLADKHNFPLADRWVEHLEGALDTWDLNAQAEQFVEEVSAGDAV